MSYSHIVTEFTKKLLEESGLNTKTHLQRLKDFKHGHEKIDYAYTFLKTTPTFQDIFENSRVVKSNSISNDLQRKGKKYFSDGDHTNALECLTKNVLNAGNDSKTLASAYRERAYLLFSKNYHAQCLQDVDRALQIECSTTFRDTLTKLKKMATELKSKYAPRFSVCVPELHNKNRLCSSASSHIEMRNDELVGRHFIAAKDIKAGDILIVEKSFTHMVFPESQYLHCHECLSLCYNLIPCPKCTKALFCSEICRKLSWETYHKYECKMIPLYQQLSQNFVKMVVVAVTQFNQESKDAEKYCSDRFSEVGELVTNEEKRESVNFFYPIIMSCIGYHDFKTNTNIFCDFSVTDNYLKDLTYKCIMIDSINSFYIKKYSEYDDNSQKIAQGIFSFSSFFNHSCAPNCQFFFHGRHLAIRALSNIKRGEECNISYYGFCPFASVEYAERQSYLRNVFFFDCHCTACTNRWPMFEVPSFRTTETEMVNSSEMGGHTNKSDSNQVVDGENKELQSILLQLEKAEIHPSQTKVYWQKKLINQYRRIGNTMVNF